LNKEALVAVIIPTFGGGRSISGTIQSILNQDFSDISITVVDDNGIASDKQIETEMIVTSFRQIHEIQYIIQKENMNASVARNTGATNTKSKYLIFIDDDDLMMSNNIARQIMEFEKLDSSWGLTYCSTNEYFDGELYAVRRAKKSGNLFMLLLLKKISCSTSSWIIRRETFDELGGFDPTFWRHQDYEFIARLSQKYKIKAVPYLGIEKYWKKITIFGKQEYMNRYLETIDKLTADLCEKKRKEIFLVNQLSVDFSMLRSGQKTKFCEKYPDFFSRIIIAKVLLRIIFQKIDQKIIVSIHKLKERINAKKAS